MGYHSNRPHRSNINKNRGSNEWLEAKLKRLQKSERKVLYEPMQQVPIFIYSVRND